jgi:predicted TIM-barrel fold metal-dependent hydrolase
MAYEGKVISGDCHIDIPWLPADLFVSNAPARLRDKMPKVLDTDQGKQWFADGQQLGWVAGAGIGEEEGAWNPYKPGLSNRLDRMEDVGFFSDGQRGLFHPTTPELRIKDQETDGIEGEVIYGVLGLGGDPNAVRVTDTELGGSGDSPGPGYGLTDPELIQTAYDIYNEWLADFCKSTPNRFKGLACLSGHDPKVAANQLRRAAEMGLSGAEMNVATAAAPIYQKEWDVLWDAASETGLPISFHTLGLVPRYPDAANRETYRWVSDGIGLGLFQLSGAEFLLSIAYSGACDRFPNFKFVLGECGVGWIPYILHRMDEGYEKWLFHLNLDMKPSEYWHRQGYSTFQHEFLTDEIVGMIGEDRIIWGSDYPHPDSIWPDSRQVIDENLGHLDEKYLRKIVYENSVRLYGFST